jgi:RNA polymerase sigma-70 factor (ECF subfamily)
MAGGLIHKEVTYLPCADADSERRLLAEAKSGQPAALAALHEHHRASVYDLAFTLTGNHDDAEDVRQMTFVRAFLGIRKFRGDCAFRTWLLRICLNAACSWRKRHHPSSPPQEPPYPDPVAEAHRRVEAEEIRRRIAALPRWARELIALCDLQGLSYRDAAQVLGCSPKGVGPRLHRARRLLKERLTDLL